MRFGLAIVAASSLATFAAIGAFAGDLSNGQTPASVAADTSTTAQPTAESGAATASAASPAAPVPSADAPPGPADEKAATPPPPANLKIPPGYRVVKRGNKTLYCMTYTPTGSRMTEVSCMSREQVEQLQQQAESERQMQ